MKLCRETASLSSRASWLACLLACAIAACAGCSQPTCQVTFVPIADSPFAPEKTAQYVLYPGDLLMFRFPSDPTLDQEVRIRSDGKISLPHVGDIVAAQRSPEELAKDLSKRYEGVIKKPEVTVIVAEETGRRVYLGGQVRSPGAFPLRGDQTLAQAIFEAGGMTGTAHAGDILILRSRPGEGVYVLKVDLERILAGNDVDVRLEPQDVVHVPETAIARVDRFVEQYINGLIPRAASFSFTTELKTQPVRVTGQNNAQFPVQITR